MLIPGLVSVTFRKLTPEEIISLCNKAGVQAIEWGGDIHVPSDNVARAREVGQRTRDAGLIVASYGSYYLLGGGGRFPAPFEQVLATASALGAPTIRIWAGGKGAKVCPPEERAAIVADGLRVAEIAAKSGITVCLEYHPNTLTDDADSVRLLLKELDHPNLEFLWQPRSDEGMESCTARLLEVLPRLRNVHVYQWTTKGERRPLAEGEAEWRTYIDIVRGTGKSADFLLEFVLNDSPEQFIADAAALRRMLSL